MCGVRLVTIVSCLSSATAFTSAFGSPAGIKKRGCTRWEGWGTHTGPAYCDFLVGCLPAASAQKMRFSGTTVLRISNGKIAEQIGLDDGVTALLQLGLRGAA